MDIVAELSRHGIDAQRLDRVLAPRADRWGQLVHAYEVLTVLAVVRKAMDDYATGESK